MSTESIINELENLSGDKAGVKNDGKSLLYITKVNIKNENNILPAENEKLFSALLKHDIIDHPIHNTDSLNAKLNQLRDSWVDLNLFSKDAIRFEVDLSSDKKEYENELKKVVDSSFADVQEDLLHQREIFNFNKPIPVELNIYSKLNNFQDSTIKVAASASNKAPFSYQLSYLGKALNIQNNAVFNYSVLFKTSVLKNQYSPTLAFNLDSKFIRQPNSKMYLQANCGIGEQNSNLKDVKLGFFKQLTKCSLLDLGFKTNLDTQFNILFNYQQNLDKISKFSFNFDHNVSSLKNNWNISVLSHFNQSKNLTTDNKLTFNDEKLSNNLTCKLGQSVFTSLTLSSNYTMNNSELNSDLILTTGFKGSNKGPVFEFGFKQPYNKDFEVHDGFFYNIIWQY